MTATLNTLCTDWDCTNYVAISLRSYYYTDNGFTAAEGQDITAIDDLMIGVEKGYVADARNINISQDEIDNGAYAIVCAKSQSGKRYAVLMLITGTTSATVEDVWGVTFPGQPCAVYKATAISPACNVDHLGLQFVSGGIRIQDRNRVMTYLLSRR